MTNTNKDREEFIYKFENGDFGSTEWSQADPKVIWFWIEKYRDKVVKQTKQELKKEVKEILGNIKRFDSKEKGVDYYAGWDNCLDTIIMDFKELLEE